MAVFKPDRVELVLARAYMGFGGGEKYIHWYVSTAGLMD